MAGPSSSLVAYLLRTREALERLIAILNAAGELSVSDEQALRRAKRVLRNITHEYLPWARSPGLTAAKAAEVTLRVNVAWKQLSLKRYEG